jgi:hypothetical protein
MENLNPNLPPEEQFRQPGAVDHEKMGSWFNAHRVLVYIVLVLLAALIVIGVFYYQSLVKTSVTDSPMHHDDVASWKTFTAPEKYTFKYPNNFFVFKDSVAPGIYYIYDVNSKPGFLEQNYSNMKVSITSFESVPFFKADFQDELDKYDYQVESSENLTISGSPAYRFNLKGPTQEDLRDPNGPDTNVYVGIAYANGGGIEIKFESKNLEGSDKYKQDLEIFNKILDSFTLNK